MKNIIRNLVGVTTVAALSLFAVGCATTAQNTAITSAAITTLTAVGATEYIINKPVSRPDFVAADVALAALATTNAVTAGQVQAALSAVTPGANQSSVAVAITDVLPLFQAYVAQPSTNSTLSSVQLGVNAIVAGLNQAIAATAPTPVAPVPVSVPLSAVLKK